MNEKQILDALFESSSLREDLLNRAMSVIKDLLNCVELTDEVMARVSDETYEFIKGLKK